MYVDLLTFGETVLYILYSVLYKNISHMLRHRNLKKADYLALIVKEIQLFTELIARKNGFYDTNFKGLSAYTILVPS